MSVLVNPLCVAEVAHIFFAAIRVVYNLVSDPAVMLKALEIFDPALPPNMNHLGYFPSQLYKRRHRAEFAAYLHTAFRDAYTNL